MMEITSKPKAKKAVVTKAEEPAAEEPAAEVTAEPTGELNTDTNTDENNMVQPPQCNKCSAKIRKPPRSETRGGTVSLQPIAASLR